MPSSTYYAVLLALVIGMGCGEGDTTPSTTMLERIQAREEKDRRLKAEALREMVVGTYEDIEDEETYRIVLLEKGAAQNIHLVGLL